MHFGWTHLAAAVLAFFMVAQSASAETCPWRGRWIWGRDAKATASAKSGQICLYMIHVRRGSVRGLNILSPPGNGAAVVVSQSTLSYQSLPGFKGKDRLIVQVSGTGARARGATRLTMIISVD